LTDQAVGYAIGIRQDIRSRNAHHGQAALGQPSISTFVPLRLVAHVVAPAVDFDDQSGVRAIEI
jgi:hypothetical protein